MKIYYEDDANLEIIQSMNVTIVGYGSQGHAHANNLHESGVNVTVALREGSSSWKKAEEAGLNVSSVSESVKNADLVMILAPDEFQKDIYESEVKPNLKQDAILAFAHGFNIHFEKISPPETNSVIMIAPKGPGHTVRSTYVNGGGVPSLIAVYRDSITNNDFQQEMLHFLMPKQMEEQELVFLRPLLKKKQKQIYLESKLFYVEALQH